MTTDNQVERILFYNLIDRAQGHSFALLSSTSSRCISGENQFRHLSLLGRLKKKGYEVYDFRARIEDTFGCLNDTLMYFVFVVDIGSSWDKFKESIVAIIDPFDGGRATCVDATCKVTCHEELGEKHRVYLSRMSNGKDDFYRQEYTTGDEIVLGWPMVIEGDIKYWPMHYTWLLDKRGYDTRIHWKEAYEECNRMKVKRTAREQIALDTEYHDAALIGVEPAPDYPESVLRQEISLRAFLRSHFTTWSRQLLKSHYQYHSESEKLPMNLWYVCDEEDTGALLPAVYERGRILRLQSFLWISAGGTVDKISIFDPLPEFISTQDALVLLENQNRITKNVYGYSQLHPEKIPHRLAEYFLGDQFSQDRRPEIHGIAENQSRYLKDRRLADIDWESIELTEENMK